MIEEIISESTIVKDVSPGRKIHSIGLYNRLAIIISGLIIVLSLTIPWILWLTIYCDGINYYVDTFNFLSPNNFLICFIKLTIIIFIVVGLTIVLVIVPFAFIKNKNLFSALLSLISFILATWLVIAISIFVVIRYDTIKYLIENGANVNFNPISLKLVVFLPFAIAAAGAIFLLGNSIWLLINISSKYYSNVYSLPIMKPKNHKLTSMVELPVMTQEPEDEISIPFGNQDSKILTSASPSQQSVNITINNNPASANQKLFNDQNKDNLQSQPNIPIYTSKAAPSDSESMLSSTIEEHDDSIDAYASEAVSNQNQESDIKYSSKSLVEPVSPMVEKNSEPNMTSNPDISIYSATRNAVPTASSKSSSISKYDDLLTDTKDVSINESEESTTTAPTSYEPQNQGGFDEEDGTTLQQSYESEFKQQKPTVSNSTYSSAQQKPTIKPSPTIKPEVPKYEQSKPQVTVHHWTLEQIQTVWEKAQTIEGVSDKLYRKDYAGAWMFRDSFDPELKQSNSEKTYSWSIVLHRPVSQNGTTELFNLDPMNVVNVISKGENYPRWTTDLTSKGNENFYKKQNWKARS